MNELNTKILNLNYIDCYKIINSYWQFLSFLTFQSKRHNKGQLEDLKLQRQKEKENFCHIGYYNLWCRKYVEELDAVSKDY